MMNNPVDRGHGHQHIGKDLILWSSFRATCGLAPTPEWLSVDWVLSKFSENIDEARDRYREFVGERITDFSPWDALIGRVFWARKDSPKSLDHDSPTRNNR
ncbi:MAG: hypothetical protein P1P74_04270 [Desulfuromonadales bacterium]|nr:hypothetical protein [Desulfuromonadales bacterium]